MARNIHYGVSCSVHYGAADTGLTVLDVAGSGYSYRIFKMLVTSRSTITGHPIDIEFNNGFGTYYGDTGTPIVVDFLPEGKKQSTSNSVITVTTDTPAEISAMVLYVKEQDD